MSIDVLSTREVPGYPHLRISLVVNQGEKDENYTVVIRDHVQTTEYNTASKKEAANRYFHPFCYGYEYPVLASVSDDGA